MTVQITQDAVVYLIIAVVVCLVGVSYIVGVDVFQLLRGRNAFASPSASLIAEITSSDSFLPEGFRVRVDNVKILYTDSRETTMELLPILDIGNTPLHDDAGGGIRCVFERKTYTCEPSPGSFTFTLKPEAIQWSAALPSKSTPVQLYLFRKTPAITAFIDGAASSRTRTTSRLLETFTDYYIGNFPVGTIDTSTGGSSLLGDFCRTKDRTACGQTDFCYFIDSCIPCELRLSCEDYPEQACGKCRYADRCAWIPSEQGGPPRCTG